MSKGVFIFQFYKMNIVIVSFLCEILIFTYDITYLFNHL